MGDLRPFLPARLLPVLGMGDLYLYAFSPGSAGYGRSAPAVPLWLGSIFMSICGGDLMAARSFLPAPRLGMGDLCPFSPALVPGWSIRPARCADVLRVAPFSLFYPFSHTNSHFCPFRPIFADFCPFRAAAGSSIASASKVCNFFTPCGGGQGSGAAAR